jgi:hypothetical protein
MNLGGYFIPAGTIVLRVGQVTSNDVSAENFTYERDISVRWLLGLIHPIQCRE